MSIASAEWHALTFVQHLSSVVSGIAAATISVAILAIIGSVMHSLVGKPSPRTLSDAVVPAASLVAIYCWYGVKLNVPLPLLLGTVASFATIVFAWRIFRYRLTLQTARPLLAYVFDRSAIAFSFFYTLAYLFVMPPVSVDRLPIATIGNHDILNYINVGEYLQHLGPSNIPGRFANSLSYEATPAVFPALQAMAALLGGDIMQAAMPTMLATVALIGVTITSITRTAFALSHSVALAIAAIVISGPLFRYTSGQFFLGQMLGSLMLLLLLSKTMRVLADRNATTWLRVTLSLLPYYLLIFYLYPVFVVLAATLQVMLIAGYRYLLPAFGETQEAGSSFFNPTIAQWSIGTVASMGVAAAVDPRHFLQMANWVLLLSNVKEMGWPLTFISPAAIVGVPGRLEINGQGMQVTSMIAFCIVMSVIAYLYLVHTALRGSATGKILFLIAMFTWVFYVAYFLAVGPSYRQWKMATYLPLLMSFALWGACIVVIRGMVRSEPAGAFAAQSVCVLLVLGNLLLFALREPPLETFSGTYANLRALDAMGKWTELYVRMSSYAATFFPVYFVPHKTLHLLSHSYYPNEQIDLSNVSPRRPLFVEGEECSSEIAATTIVGVGCLYLKPSTIEFGVTYRLSSQLPIAIEEDGLSHREPWGRWSERDKAVFRLFASEADLSNVPRGFVNFDVHPYVGRGPSQRISIRWGNRNDQVTVDGPRMVSVPFDIGDWTGKSVRVMTITMEFPDAIAPHAVDPNSGDLRKLGIGFRAISVTAGPLGSAIRDDGERVLSLRHDGQN